MECHKCGHEWNYTGNQSDWATCPSCNTSVKIGDGFQGEVIQRLEDIESKLDRVLAKANDVARAEVESEDGGGSTNESGGIYDPTEEWK
jgi:hypothetical protein